MRRDHRLLLIMLALGVMFTAASMSAHAQAPKFKEGDRVEVDTTHVDVLHGGNPAFQR
jgi:hypothetical protein